MRSGSFLPGALLLCLLLAGQAQAADVFRVTGVESWDTLNMRTSPDHTSGKIGAIPADGRCVETVGPEQQVGNYLWLHVRYGSMSGWVNSKYLEPMDPGACGEEGVAVVDSGDPAVNGGDAQAPEEDEIPPGLMEAAERVLYALRDRRMKDLAAMAHPVKGVRFSPYGHIQPARDVRLMPDELVKAFLSPSPRNWGTFDGSGETILMTLSQYLDRFVYDVDFAGLAETGVDTVLGTGNMVDNIADVYPDAHFVEFHIPGINPAYQGMDWRSLRLVFRRYQDLWVLVGVVHDEWTT